MSFITEEALELNGFKKVPSHSVLVRSYYYNPDRRVSLKILPSTVVLQNRQTTLTFTGDVTARMLKNVAITILKV